MEGAPTIGVILNDFRSRRRASERTTALGSDDDDVADDVDAEEEVAIESPASSSAAFAPVVVSRPFVFDAARLGVAPAVSFSTKGRSNIVRTTGSKYVCGTDCRTRYVTACGIRFKQRCSTRSARIALPRAAVSASAASRGGGSWGIETVECAAEVVVEDNDDDDDDDDEGDDDVCMGVPCADMGVDATFECDSRRWCCCSDDREEVLCEEDVGVGVTSAAEEEIRDEGALAMGVAKGV